MVIFAVLLQENWNETIRYGQDERFHKKCYDKKKQNQTKCFSTIRYGFFRVKIFAIHKTPPKKPRNTIEIYLLPVTRESAQNSTLLIAKCEI